MFKFFKLRCTFALIPGSENVSTILTTGTGASGLNLSIVPIL